jgi:hypothetical protein
MSTDLENLTASFGLVRREFRDAHAVVSRLDTQMRRLVEPRALPRPGGLVARFAAVGLIARAEKRNGEAVAKQYFPDDRDLAQLITWKSATRPAMTTVAGWVNSPPPWWSRRSPVTATTDFLAPDILNKCCRAVPALTHAHGRTQSH